MTTPTYNKFPVVPVLAAYASQCWSGWEEIIPTLAASIDSLKGKGRSRIVVAVECYTGVRDDHLRTLLAGALSVDVAIDAKSLFKPTEEIEQLAAPFLGGEDPVFGFMTGLMIEDFLDTQRVKDASTSIEKRASGVVLVVGPGASQVFPADLLLYADMPRWEGQLRQRRGEADNLGVRNRGLKASLQYKRSFFVDWRVCDRIKTKTLSRWDFLLDTTDNAAPKLITGTAHAAALLHAVTGPFRVVPFFDPGPWGGQWLRQKIGLPEGPPNYAWGFDCVPEENSLLLEFGETRVEIPSINLVFAQPALLLGEAVYRQFGAEFPIRFDFLDTIQGGNLSFQVHPLAEYAREHFGISYTQDESYYILDAEPGAVVYLGAKDGVQPEAVLADLKAAQRGEKLFDDQKFAARFPAKKHDHFLIPAGTLHCSGAGSVVLEISATPYIFTFKLWDWARLGLDGLPRPVNIERGQSVIQWDRNEDYARRHLVNQIEVIERGDGWHEERTGLHTSQFIETRRHWFSVPVRHRRTSSVDVLNLVEGEAVVVESPESRFAPVEIHYAETFILPAAAGDYIIRPLVAGAHCATVKAFVRVKD